MGTIFRARTRQAAWLSLIVAYLAAVAGGIVGVTTFPSSGAQLAERDGNLVITGFEPGSDVWVDGGREGDIVELINGEPAVEAFNAGDQIKTVTIRPADSLPGEDLSEIDIYVSPTSLINITVGLNIIGLAFAVISVLIYLRARRNTDTVMFALMAMSSAASLAIGPASVANHPWARLVMGAALYVSAIMFLSFFISFTRSDSAKSKWFKTWLPEMALALSVATVLLWVLPAIGFPEMFNILRPGMFLMLGVSLIGGIGLLAYRLRTADRANQEQLRIVTLGTVIGLVPFIWLTIIPVIVSGQQIVSGEVSVLGFILIPVAFGYAIARHDLMGIRRLFHRGAAYAIISAAIIMVYGTVLTGLNLLAPNSEALGPIQGALFVLMFAGAPALTSVRRTALRIVDRVIYEGAVTQDDLVSAISTVSANETNPQRALNRAISFAGQGFDVEYAALISFDGDRPTIEHTYNNPDSEVLDALGSITKQESRRAKRGLLPGTDQTALMATLREVGREPRMVVLGPKVSEDIFTDEDVTLLDTVTAVVSTALTRLRLLDEVQEQSEQLKNMGTEMQNIQEIERQEISAYLHDEPLQKLAYVNSRIRELDISEDLKKLLEDVVRDLRGTSASLSPEMLRSHGLMTAMKWMVQEQGQRGPFRVFFEVNGIQDEERFPDDMELTIYRASQEALNNCRKHANAKSVWVKLTKTDSRLELAIEDNGIGIKATTGDMEERSPDQGLGIRGLKQRVTNLGGTLEIVPRPSRGTAFVVKLPLDAEDLKAAS